MEQLNRIEIRGYVGSVSFFNGGDRRMARFSVATSYAYKDRDGSAVIDTTWHSVVAWEGKGIQDLDKVVKGSKVYVMGRLRAQKYCGADGVERTSYEITASKVSLIGDDEPFACEF